MCKDCLLEIIQRIKSIDVVVLNSLKNTTPQTGLVIDDIIDEVEEKRSRIYAALDRLKLIGAVDYIIEERWYRYYITDIGQSIIYILNND